MKELVEEYYRKMDSLKGDYSQMTQVFDPDMKFHFPGIPSPLSLESFQGIAQSIYQGFGDFQHQIEDVVIDGDKIACRLSITGTHTGVFQDIPATHQSVAINAITIFRTNNEKLAEHWISVDMLGILTQIGALPSN